MTELRKKVVMKKVASTPVPFLSKKGETAGETRARAILSPAVSAATIAFDWTPASWREGFDIADAVTTMINGSDRVNRGDLSEIVSSLSNQAVALNSMFTTLAQRARANMLEHPEAFERYMKLALKTQNQARMTLETLANVKNPPVVYAKQANISNGPQQINNTLNAHGAKTENPQSKILEHTHEQRLDTGTESITGCCNRAVETVAEVHRT
jgi:hypothetical protein